MNVGLIGYGYWGKKLHQRLSLENDNDSRLLVCDPAVERCEADYHRILSYIDAVVIATPPKTHYEIARDCLEAGKHVLVEKPMAMKSDHAWNLYELARVKGLTLMVDDTWTKWPGLIERLGPTGNYVAKSGEFYWANPRSRGVSEEGILWTQGPHPISLAIVAMGKPPGGVIFDKGGPMGMGFTLVDMTRREGTISVCLNWATNQKVRAFRIETLTKNNLSVYSAFDSLYEDLLYAGTPPDPLSEIVRLFLDTVKSGKPFQDLRGVQVVQTLEMVEKVIPRKAL